MWTESRIERVIVRTPTVAGAAARVRQALVDETHPPNLPEGALLVVRALEVESAAGRLPLREALTALVEAAARPDDPLVLGAPAVLFADEVELVVTLAEDAAAERWPWWWGVLRRSPAPIGAVLAEYAHLLPEVARRLAGRGTLGVVFSALDRGAARRVLQTVAEVHGLATLQVLLDGLRAPMTRVERAPPPHWDSVRRALGEGPRPPEALALGAVVLTLARAPVSARGPSFAMEILHFLALAERDNGTKDAARSGLDGDSRDTPADEHRPHGGSPVRAGEAPFDTPRGAPTMSGPDGTRPGASASPTPATPDSPGSIVAPSISSMPAAGAVGSGSAAEGSAAEGSAAEGSAAKGAARNGEAGAAVAGFTGSGSAVDTPGAAPDPDNGPVEAAPSATLGIGETPGRPEITALNPATRQGGMALPATTLPGRADTGDPRRPVDAPAGRSASSPPETAAPAPWNPWAEADDEELLRDTAPFRTAYGGIFYLVNVALALSWYPDFTRPREAGLDVPLPALLLAVGPRFVPNADPDDPIWAWLRSKLEPTSSVGRHRDDAANLDDPVPGLAPERVARLVAELRARLAEGIDLDPADLCAQPAEVHPTPPRVEVRFVLEHHPIEIRLSGLDRDPGWLPAAGWDLRFRYELAGVRR